jgi:hypothetical protein
MPIEGVETPTLGSLPTKHFHLSQQISIYNEIKMIYRAPL